MTSQSLKDDIAYLRTVSEEGQRARPQGGLILAVAGFGWALAALANWAELEGRVHGVALWAWLVPAPLFVAALTWVTVQSRRQTDYHAPGNRAAYLAWRAIGTAMGAVVLSFMAATWVTQNGQMFAMMPPAFFALYGAAWLIYGALSKQTWVIALGWLSFAAAPLTALLANDEATSMLAYAAGLSLLVGVPGLVMMLQQRSHGA